MSVWQQIIPIIEQNSRFVITTHLNPDGDALGSELALAEHLLNLGKEVAIINSDPTPTIYRFLDPCQRIKKFSARQLGPIHKAEVIVVVDASGGWKRVGRPGEAFSQAKAIKVCIDHHPDPTDFANAAVVDTEAAAAGELIYELITAMNGRLSLKMAEVLYAAILTDTGSFRFPKTSSRTHRIIAELLQIGVQPLEMYRQIYEQYSLLWVKLKGHVLDSIKTEARGQVAYYGLDQETLKAYKVKAAELDGFASLGQQIGGVKIVVFCLQSSRSKVKISLRSDGSISINQLAAAYGGGGHPSAAGATVSGKLEEVMAEVVARAKALVEW